MKVWLIFFAIFFCKISYASEWKNWHKSRSSYLESYISKLKSFQVEDKRYKGSVVEALDGSLHINFGVGKQSEIDKIALNKCKTEKKLKCKVRFQSFKKNKDYNRFAKFDYTKNLLLISGLKINSKVVDKKNGIIFLKNSKNFKISDTTCKKNTTNYDMIINTYKNEINIYPSDFLNKSGLKFIMICEELLISDRKVAAAVVGHHDQSLGVMYISAPIVMDNIKQLDYVKHIFHHELYHLIDSQLTSWNVDSKWNKINKSSYSKDTVLIEYSLDNSVKGFISGYARFNEREDKAELYAFLIKKNKEVKKLLNEDKVLFDKAKLLISRLKSISSSINKDFWIKLN